MGCIGVTGRSARARRAAKSSCEGLPLVHERGRPGAGARCSIGAPQRRKNPRGRLFLWGGVPWEENTKGAKTHWKLVGNGPSWGPWANFPGKNRQQSAWRKTNNSCPIQEKKLCPRPQSVGAPHGHCGAPKFRPSKIGPRRPLGERVGRAEDHREVVMETKPSRDGLVEYFVKNIRIG